MPEATLGSDAASSADASLRLFFEPRSLVVVGVSHEPATVGYRLQETILHAGDRLALRLLTVDAEDRSWRVKTPPTDALESLISTSKKAYIAPDGIIQPANLSLSRR